MRGLDGITNGSYVNLGKLCEMLRGREAWRYMGSQRVGHNWETEYHVCYHSLVQKLSLLLLSRFLIWKLLISFLDA